MLRSLFGVALVIAVLAGCEGGSSAGEVCRGDEQCASGHCAPTRLGDGVCADTCEEIADCPWDLRCSEVPGQDEQLCLPPCEHAAEGFVCNQRGMLVACEDAGDEWNCFDCGCPNGQYCESGGLDGCVAAHPDGAACTGHDQCTSGNCSGDFEQVGFCQVAEGRVCTDENCVWCDQGRTGTSCAQTCWGDGQCAAGETCLGSLERDEFACRPSCDPLRPVDSCAYGWQCLSIDHFGQNRWVCLPTETCDLATNTGCGQGTRCRQLANAAYAICAPFCSPFNPACPGSGWSCQEVGNFEFACVPPT